MQYESTDLVTRLRAECEASVREGRMAAAEACELVRAYESGLEGYTYLEQGLGEPYDG